MSDNRSVHRYYGDSRYRLRLLLKVMDDRPFTNRDLLSIAHVIDWATRAAARDTLLEVGPNLDLGPDEASALSRRLDELPAAFLDAGELVEFRQGSWQIVLDLPDTAIVLLLLYLLRTTLGQDFQTAWSHSRGSKRFRELLTTSIPAAIRAAAEGLRSRLRRSGRLGSRHVVESVKVHETNGDREIRLIIVGKRSTIILPQDDVDEEA